MKKAIKIICIIIACILALPIAAVGGFNSYQHISNREFYSNAQKEFKVPGISDGLIQQGFYNASDGNILVCGYMKGGSASRIYLLGKDGEVVKYVELYKDGKADTNHAGGISEADGKIFLCDGSYISVYSYNGLKTAQNDSSVTPTSSFELPLGAAFCYTDEKYLYVGEFYREQNYPTDETHHMTTPGGEVHHSLLAAYELSQLKADNYEKGEPVFVCSIPDLAQGFTIAKDGAYCISTSYAVATSHIYIYSNPLSTASKNTIDINGKQLPLYYLDTDNLIKDVTLYPMAEEIFYQNGRIYIINESASAKYIFGKFTGGGYVYSYEYK